MEGEKNGAKVKRKVMRDKGNERNEKRVKKNTIRKTYPYGLRVSFLFLMGRTEGEKQISS